MYVVEPATGSDQIYSNEIAVRGGDNDSAERLLLSVQALSENPQLIGDPGERLEYKIQQFNDCTVPDCDVVADAWRVLDQNSRWANIEYSFNQLGSTDEWFKFAVFDLERGERIRASDLYTQPEKVAALADDIYVKQIDQFLAGAEPDDEQEEMEYELYAEHLEERDKFLTDDLNNMELVVRGDSLIAIRFHYNGMAGQYRAYFPKGEIELPVSELGALLRADTLKQLQIN